MSDRVKAKSALHGHTLGVSFNEEAWMEKEEITQSYSEGFQPMVSELLRQARGLDLTKDYAFMPYPATSMEEALCYLSRHGKVGLQGGHMYYHEKGQSFSCAVLGKTPTPITIGEVRALLRANYRASGIVPNE